MSPQQRMLYYRILQFSPLITYSQGLKGGSSACCRDSVPLHTNFGVRKFVDVVESPFFLHDNLCCMKTVGESDVHLSQEEAMKKALLLAAVILLIAGIAYAQEGEDVEKAEAGIKQAALDYVDGYYSGDAERLARGIHPSLQKVMVTRISGGREIFNFADRELLLEAVKAGMGKIPEDKRKLKVTVLSVFNNIASVKIDSAMFVDFAHIAELNGEWRVVNVLWAMQSTSPREIADEERTAIKQAALDYVEGYYEGDGKRNERGVHPTLHKVVVRNLPNGREFLHRIDRHSLIEITNSGSGKLPAEERNIEVEILDVFRNMAAVRIPSARFVDYAHVAYINGEWKVTNVLWAPAS